MHISEREQYAYGPETTQKCRKMRDGARDDAVQAELAGASSGTNASFRRQPTPVLSHLMYSHAWEYHKSDLQKFYAPRCFEKRRKSVSS